ncbi:hypothetical protein CLAFUW4_09669 [Fulvia fulva]|uniref:Uncharacterized protein n=1 Tax=Passalora fulva TaxID=5499 RepID=A0A9Q8UTA8_PASFU|nr:uncharacterized protein CLAFUR5_09763 [Fulvia fulva]KAK4613436.1 hypothetical protein CLAFUR4_09674 [Fulvia fulva]KAK4615000.1 hypothetical protein CLAFUR0_09665 [Fulvia fulva]UJO21612.1 hypothetical protein CLAFUR5_09763 [Fulvia fulva]WPV20568.1 hypothetical protein CLAFUW4_09669 [Fulvia fulva]WPV35162.1 hypothetical protein CLAFUW7_09670 [Fulvia fulva]
MSANSAYRRVGKESYTYQITTSSTDYDHKQDQYTSYFGPIRTMFRRSGSYKGFDTTSPRSTSVASNGSSKSGKAWQWLHDINEKHDRLIKRLHLAPDRPRRRSPAIDIMPSYTQLGY